MSNDPKDPKHPLDAAPQDTPELLKSELSLDRRQRAAAAEATQLTPRPEPTTDPLHPPVARRPAPPTPAQWSEQQQQQRAPRPPTPVVTAQTVEQPRRSAHPQPAPRPPAPAAIPQRLVSQRLPTAPPPAATPAASALEAMARLPVVHRAEADELPTILVPPGTVPSGPTRAPAPAQPARPPAPPPRAYRELPGALPAHLLVTDPQLPAPSRLRQSQPLATPPPTAEPEAPVEASPVVERATAPAPRARKQVADVVAEPASLVRRVGSWLIDLACIGSIVLLFLLAAMVVIAPKGALLLKSLTAVALPAALLAGLLSFVYTTVFAFFFHGRTPGRRLFGIHLVDNSGGAPGPARALFRAGLAVVSFALFLSGFWLALFDRHGQTLHDKLTGTFVVRLLDA